MCYKFTFAVCQKLDCFTLRKLSSYCMKLNMILRIMQIEALTLPFSVVVQFFGHTLYY